MRVDKWLWVARLTKTRTLAADAVKAGRVEVNGATAKPSRDVAPGDRVELRTGPVRMEVVVRGLAGRRGPAVEAAKLYEETEASRLTRERQAEERRMARIERPEGGRPTKRDRRLLQALKGRRG